MTTALNAVLHEGSQDYMEFRRAHTDSQVVIHGLSLEATSNDKETMLSVMKESLFVGQQVNVTSARLWQKDLEVRLPKKYTLVVVFVPTDEVDKITPSVLIDSWPLQSLCDDGALEPDETVQKMLPVQTS